MRRLFILLFCLIHGVALAAGQPPEIIAFLGQKGVGKDTATDFVVREYSFTKYPLADPVKKSVQMLFHFTDEQLWGDQKDIIDPYWKASPREILQFVGIDTLGSNLGERFPHIGKDYHTLSLKSWLQKHPEERIVISDLRMQEDVTQLKRMGALIIGIQRPSLESKDLHLSEANIPQIEGVDYWIVNDGSIEQLEEKIKTILENK